VTLFCKILTVEKSGLQNPGQINIALLRRMAFWRMDKGWKIPAQA